MHVKPYNHQIEETNISHLEKTNSLVEIPVHKPTNEKISIPLDYPESQKFRWHKQLQENHFINNFTDKTALIFVSHRNWANYKLSFQLCYDRIITTLGDLFKQSDLTEIESFLANNVL